MSIVVEQTFHPVGHGTFHTGRARYHGEPGSFSWVYDCGSKRRSTLAPAIQAFSRSLRGTHSQIDLLVISHFDDDHVNGVESLLATCSVKWLALPYTDLASRLAQAAAVNDEPCSSSTALFQLDPVQWLAVRGLSDRVENLLFVEGGPAPDTPPEPEPQSDDPDWPRRPSSREDENLKRPAEREEPHDVRSTNLEELVTPLNTSGSAGAAAPRLALLQHSQPVHALGPDLEFMFYNSDQPDMCRTSLNGVRIARRSKAPLAQVEAEILQLTQQLQIGQPGVKPRRPWRAKLRDVYDRHFGKSGQARNNISLCLMTRVYGPLCEPDCLICWEGTASLCLGDLTVTAATINSMQRHFAHRWSGLAAVQIPHHGSRHSWSRGNACHFNSPLFIHCVPDESQRHPHPTVEEDIQNHLTLRANYSQGVTIQMGSRGWFNCWLSP
ncbi:hypothetical protein ACUS6C_04185 [Pseudomonas aeruginosa]